MFPQNLFLHHQPNLFPVLGSLSFCLLQPPSIPMPQNSAEAAPHPPVRMGSEFQWAIITSVNIMQNAALCPQASQRAAHSFLSLRLHNKVGKCANLKGNPTTQGSLPILQSQATRWTVTSQGPLGRVTEMQFPVRVPEKSLSTKGSAQLLPRGLLAWGRGVSTTPAPWVPSDGNLSPYCGSGRRGSATKH